MMKQNGHMGFEEFCHALAQNQPVSFDLREKDRKELVKDISEIMSEKAEYMRMPTCAYRIGGYTITALVEMAKNSKRITARERPVDNEKYAFRCFLLRLGFIGNAYKAARRVLMKNLDGNRAFRNKK